MSASEQDIVAALHHWAGKLGIKPLDARAAILAADDKHALLRRWRRTHAAATRRILADDERKRDEAVAEQAREGHRDAQRQHADIRRAKRTAMTLGARVDALFAAWATEAGGGVAQTGDTPVRSSTSAGEPSDPNPIKPLGLALGDHRLWFQRRVEDLEAAWDEYCGLGVARSWTMATREEKDRELLGRYRGVHSSVVSQIAPYLGSKRSIEKVRAEADLKPTTGEPK